jgi:hypothetical protein
MVTTLVRSSVHAERSVHMSLTKPGTRSSRSTMRRDAGFRVICGPGMVLEVHKDEPFSRRK